MQGSLLDRIKIPLIYLAVGLLLTIAVFMLVPGWTPAFLTLLPLMFVVGAFILAFGLSFVPFIKDHPWLIPVIVILAAAGVGILIQLVRIRVRS